MTAEQQQVVDHLKEILDANVDVLAEGQNPASVFQGLVHTFLMTLREMIAYSEMPATAANTTRQRHETIMSTLPIVRKLFDEGFITLDDPVQLESFYPEGVDFEAGGDGPHNNSTSVYQLIVPAGVGR